MANFLVLLIAFGVGAGLRLFGKAPPNAAATLNTIIITVCLPCVALVGLHGVPLGMHAAFPILMPWVFFLLTAGIFFLTARLLGWDRKTLGALILTGSFGNTSFVGFPLLEAIYGPRALGVGVLVDQGGSFLALSTLGIASASLCANRKPTLRQMLRRMVGFPPFFAMIFALALRPWEYPAWLTETLNRLSSPLAPLAMISVGTQLRLDYAWLRPRLAPLACGLGVKLLAGPALLFGVVFATRNTFDLHGPSVQITLLEAAMAPMITGAILAEEFGLDAELANLMVSLGIPISLVCVPIWARVFSGL